jgi:hypothetical protein
MQVQLNQQNQNRVVTTLQQINQLQVNLEELVKVILDSQDIDYSNKDISFSEDYKTIILNDKIPMEKSPVNDSTNNELSNSEDRSKEPI